MLDFKEMCIITSKFIILHFKGTTMFMLFFWWENGQMEKFRLQLTSLILTSRI